MQNPHLVVGKNRRCLCGIYNVNGAQVHVTCPDVLNAAQAMSGESNPNATLLFVVLRELLVDCAD